MDIAIVGCGDVAGQYAPAITAHDDLHIAAVADLDAGRAEARALVDAADDRGVVLGCAPYPIEGDAQRLAWRLVEDGRLGTVR